MTDDAFFIQLLAARQEIARLRAQGFHCVANNQRDDMLNTLETWLDPQAGALRLEQIAADREMTRAAGARAARLALMIDDVCGF